MKRLSTALLLVSALLCGIPLQAAIFPEGGGIVYGQGFAFNLKAPKGWVLDNESGSEQGMVAVFYPKGSNWSDSAIVAYARSRPKTAAIATADDAAKETVKQFHSSGNPNYQGKMDKTIKTDAGQDVVIYHFNGDQWNNYEAVAYFVEKDRINFIVLSSRDQKVFEQSLPAFEELAKSYKAMAATVTPPKS